MAPDNFAYFFLFKTFMQFFHFYKKNLLDRPTNPDNMLNRPREFKQTANESLLKFEFKFANFVKTFL